MIKERPLRPKPLVRFDQFYFAALAVNLASTLLLLPRIEQEIVRSPELAASGYSVLNLFPQLVASFLVLLLPWFFASRMRSNLARWFLVISATLFAISSALKLPMLTTASDVLISIANVALCLGAVSCLLLPEARLWFRRA